jgi:sugar phosphate isomerase/epimerase
MILGIVTNCWKTQFAEGVELDSLLATASGHGYRAIELRQGACGRYERGAELRPDVDALAGLSTRFPDLRMNLAMAMPYLNRAMTTDDELFQLGIAAAKALAGSHPVHLRLVDLVTTPEQLRSEPEAETAARLANLAGTLANAGGMLSLENSRQDWSRFLSAVRGARERLGSDTAALKVCFDACNLLNAADHPDPAVAVRELTPQMTAMIHFKQARDGATLPVVAEGDIDWRVQLARWAAVGYDGPALFEIAPDKAIWQNLAQSRRYVEMVSL